MKPPASSDLAYFWAFALAAVCITLPVLALALGLAYKILVFFVR